MYTPYTPAPDHVNHPRNVQIPETPQRDILPMATTELENND